MGDADDRLTELVRHYRTLIRAVVAKVARRDDPDLQDEIEQRVAEALWKQLRAEQTIHHPASYLYRCAVRETIRELRRQLATDQEPAGEAPTGDPGSAAAASELARITDECLAELHPDRAAAARAHLAGFDVEEIMRMHGWTYQRARNLIARGVADLRRRLALRGVP